MPHAFLFEVYDDSGKAIREHGTIALYFGHWEFVRYHGVDVSQSAASRMELSMWVPEESEEAFL